MHNPAPNFLTPIDAQMYLSAQVFGPKIKPEYQLRASGTFTTADAKTVTVVNGIIVSIV